MGGYKELPDDWVLTATEIRETSKEMSGVSLGQRTNGKET